MLTTKPRGTSDILPDQVGRWHHIEKIIRGICDQYGFSELRTPIFEHTELFERGVGETTDIVEKEMYTFKDRGDRSITLRPENTASAVRAYLENKMNAGPQPVKIYYNGPMFRYDRPQAGRYRQFHQFGVEVFGTHDPGADAEVVAMAMDFYKRLGLRDLELHLNSVGCPRCRPSLRDKLQQHFLPSLSHLCQNCRDRYQRNPLRILDCKNEGCQEIGRGAPTTLDCLCSDCGEHFSRVCGSLDSIGIPYVINRRLVRGLDYYTHTAFEIMAPDIGAQSSVGGGGRYNGLVEACGGPPTPGIGFALGLERVILTMERQGLDFGPARNMDVFIVTADKAAEDEAFKLLFRLRQDGLSADKDYLDRSLKSQMKYAGKTKAAFVAIIGETELRQGVVSIKNMASGEQDIIPLAEAVQYLKNKILQGKRV